MLKSYKQLYTVGPGETDLFDLCRPSALLVYLQDVATTHAGMIGMSREYLVEHHRAIWILARLWIHLDRPIRGFEKLSIETWHRGLTGVTWYRDFALSIDGAPVGQAVTAWVLADVETHRMKRPTGMEKIDACTANPEASLGRTLSRLACPEERMSAFEKTIRYSDLDVNAHLNNTKYADLCCDAVGFEAMPGKYLSELQINYTNECTLGDCIALRTAPLGEEAYFVDGVGHDGRARFEANLNFSSLGNEFLDIP